MPGCSLCYWVGSRVFLAFQSSLETEHLSVAQACLELAILSREFWDYRYTLPYSAFPYSLSIPSTQGVNRCSFKAAYEFSAAPPFSH